MTDSSTAWAGADSVPIFQSTMPIGEKLDRARTELLDLSARNRLLNMPRSSKGARAIAIADEKAAEIFRLLVREGKAFTFLAAGKAATNEEVDDPDGEEVAELSQPEDDVVDERGVFGRHADTRLQTRLTTKGLQKRLLEMYVDARTLEEEQGVNILYLALGTLKWLDPAQPEKVRYAPLLLVPVSLARGNVGEKFKLRVRAEEFASNLSLEAWLDRVHGIRLPAFEATDTFNPVAYMAEVAEALSAKPAWSVQIDDIALGFFSFAKFLMYRDLDATAWPESARITEQPLVRGLLSEGFDAGVALLPEDAQIDPHIPPAEMLHILDSDSSQTLAIHEVRRGRNLVIQGPPGTGKSQTIANIIASAVADGKSVLFIAEKMAALEVVKRRLDATGVGAACLELHSHKANRRSLLEELRRTWELGAPRGPDAGSLNARLTETRDQLNGHAALMHAAHPVAGLTPYEVIGQLVRLRQAGERPSDIRLDAAAEWTADELTKRRDVLSELAERVRAIGRPTDHAWCGVGLATVTPMEVDRLVSRLAPLGERLSRLDGHQHALATRIDTQPAASFDEIDRLATLARRIAAAPSAAALASTAWDERRVEILELLVTGERLAPLVEGLKGSVSAVAWSSDVEADRATLELLPEDLTLALFADFGALASGLPRLSSLVDALASSLKCGTPSTLAEVRHLLRIAERVAVAPDADPAVFAADLWGHATDRASALVRALGTLETARSTVANHLSAAAWATDLSAARSTLAAHGTSWLRHVSGEWRRANRLVRSLLATPGQPLLETLALLDALGQGQAAIRSIQQDDDFGRVAFGARWAGTESLSAPLHALVEWMRSVKDLGPHARLAAASQVDRTNVATRAADIDKLLTNATNAAERVWQALPVPSIVFGSASRVEEVGMALAAREVGRFHVADRTTAAVITPTPDVLKDRLALLAQLGEGQRLTAVIAAAQTLGASTFASDWAGTASDWPALRRTAHWVEANAPIHALAAGVVDRRGLEGEAGEIERLRSTFLADFRRFIDDLQMEGLAVTLGSTPVERLSARIEAWLSAREQLSAWTAYRDRANRGRELQCGELIDRLHDGRLAPAAVLGVFDMAYYEALWADEVRADPVLGRFDGTLHGRLVRDFTALDHQRIANSRVEVVRAHHQRLPRRDGGTVGPLGVLRAEMQKKRGHLPIRRLMERSGPAVQALKPVFMMSPLSVAQFLPRGLLDFDLLVMDEASQIQPVDAIGAVARARQVVVVGDPKQLPPTAFFAKMTGNIDDADEDDGGRVADIESILGLFAARGLPMRMLRWHYRSRHQSLIAVSNRQFYENKLLIVPSPYTAEAGMGLRFHHVPDGIFDAGGTRTNAVEALVVAKAIVEHARRHADLSLGVAAFSVAQRRAILEQLEVLRRTLPPEVEAFFQSHPTEPFFIKNLENVQGDERDVIFISVGYGAAVPGGRVPMRFGPLGTDGGERRLNVLISRAKQRCEVYASMTDEDIETDFAQTRKGVFAFRLFLHFARTGVLQLGERTGSDHEDVFENQVAKAIQARGYQVHSRVGLAGIFVDLAVADAAYPGRYLLGIECDGRSYREARSARDRDRLRQSVLESQGWTTHRIWSADWFQRPEEQLERVVARIEEAKQDQQARPRYAVERAVPINIVTVERADAVEIGLVRSDEPRSETAYREAVLRRPEQFGDDLHLAPVGLLASLVEDVVRIEGPVHVDEVVDRIRLAWGLKRTGGRIRQAVEAAINMAMSTGRAERTLGFLALRDAPIRVRDRSDALSAGLRRPEMLPPSEIAAAALEIVRVNYGATREQTVSEIARRFGFRVVGAVLRNTLEVEVDRLVERGTILSESGMLTIEEQVEKTTLPE